MQCTQTRPYKIDLIISKRRKQTLNESFYKGRNDDDRTQVRKKGTHRKMIHLTVANKVNSNLQQTRTNPEVHFNPQSNIPVSEFKIQMPEHEQEGGKTEKNDLLSSLRENQQNEDQELWWKYLKSSQEDSRMGLLKQVAKKQKKIQYFIDLLKQNACKFDAEKRQKIQKYESFLSKLKEMYSQQLQQAQNLCNHIRQLEDRSDEQLYHQLRMRINKDGKRGLNFSPKRMSLFSGVTGTLLLSKKSSGSEQRRRNYNQFSFGSSLRKTRNEESHLNCSKHSMFLDEGRISLYKKRLNFNT